jgi:HEAT repeat protein
MLFGTIVCSAAAGRADSPKKAAVDLGESTRALKSDKPAARAQAASEIGRLGPQAIAAVPELIEALQDESLAVRHEAILAIEQIGPAARAAVPLLTEILRAPESRLKIEVMNALGSIGHDALDAAPLLTDELTADDQRVAVAAAFALASILPLGSDDMKPAIPVLVKGLQNKHRQIQFESVRGLTLAGPLALPDLSELLGNYDQDPHSVVPALGVLRSLGPGAARALPSMIQALNSKHDLVVMNALNVIASLGPAGKDALPVIRKKMAAGEHQLVRTHAIASVAALRQEAAPAVPELTTTLEEKDAGLRRAAAQALGEIGARSKPAVSSLIGALRDDDQTVALAAAHALARIAPAATAALIPLIKERRVARWAVLIISEAGAAAAPAVPALRGALADADDDFARDIIQALGNIGPDASEAVPDLIKIAEDEESNLRQAAVLALGNIRARDAVPILRELVSREDVKRSDSKTKGKQEVPEKNANLSLAAAGALVLIENPDNDDRLQLALPKLINALSDKSVTIRREAAVALRQIGPAAEPAVPALLQGLNDPNPAVCSDCLWALTAVAGETSAPEIVPEILRLLNSPIPQVRYTACYAAGTLGPSAAAAVPTLEKDLHDMDQFRQLVAAWALIRIAPEAPQVREECLDPLIRGLNSPASSVRAEAAATLGLMGADAKRAVPALTELSEDRDPSLAEAGKQAMAKITGAEK